MSKTINQYYEQNWEAKEGYQMVEKLALLGYEWLKPLKKGLVLDIGCGDGTNAKRIKKLGFDVFGVDISKQAVKKAQENGIKAKVVDLNTQKLPFEDNHFDVVWLTDVIEHVFWPDELLSEIYRVLKKGGYLYLTTPNVSWYIIRLRILLGDTLKDVHPEHIHWFNKKNLLETLANHKFTQVRYSSYLRFIPYPITNRIKTLEKINFVGKPNALFSYAFAILAKK